MAWILTPKAVDDLDHLAAEGVRLFGLVQSARYQSSIVDVFDTIAAHPLLVAPHLVDGMELRLMPCGRHHILYVIENEDVVILRIVHALQNWPDLL
ncbi:type II toxin-antitoxin system RelE/ParE family toxin [Devosia faecipullorum]|uniref:type II toxin-antitoxin system RelE/ParE family toxin n=1 Tax=Devosia faecipullorum TaxID=2755039 RepID=UPI00187B8C44|nr:type II toxin-antitoxin system RelE/ParE family toxin [Devosia faecipullorum]MBE7733231.1 type II toxin-antitoxin system RelE/ParE family toxin [Devosia faecipullorum]